MYILTHIHKVSISGFIFEPRFFIIIMKKIILLFAIFILSFSLFSQISNIQFSHTLDRCTNNIGTFLEHNGRLYVDVVGAVEEYIIDDNGNLILNSYIEKYLYNADYAKIQGDSLYVLDQIVDIENQILIIDISGNEMNLQEKIILPILPGEYRWIEDLSVNEDYLFYRLHYETNNIVLDRFTFEYVTEIPTGIWSAVNDTILYLEMVNGNQSALSINDISDIYNPEEIAFLPTGEYEGNVNYVFIDSLLFITRNTEILIIDISDITNPSIISEIEDIPQTPDINAFTNLVRYEDFIIFVNDDATIWVYDISDLENPQFLNICHEYESSTYLVPLKIFNNFLYYGNTSQEITKFDALSLPDIELLDQYGKCGIIINSHFCNPYFIYQFKYQQIWYLNTLEYNPEPQLLSETEGYYDQFCNNDSLLFVLEKNDNSDENFLNIMYYDNDDLYLVNQIQLGNETYWDIYWQGNYLYISTRYSNTLRIYSINDPYSIELIDILYFNEQPYFLRSEYVMQDYLFLKMGQEYPEIKAIEASPPFNEVANIDLQAFPGETKEFYLLSENRVLILSDMFNMEPTIWLCNYIFPDELEIIDQAVIINQGPLIISNDIIISTLHFGGKADFYSWQNDSIESIYYFDFEIGVRNINLIPEISKLYVDGLFYLKEYTYESSFIEENVIQKPSFSLYNYPNPFNPETIISFSIPNQSNVELTVFNFKGQKVKQLVSDQLSAGQHNVVWNGRDEKNLSVSSGIYLYKLKVNDETLATRKCILLK